MLKGAYFGAKMKTFKDILFLSNTPYLGKEIQRISAESSQENAYSQFPIRRSHLLPYAIFMKITIQRHEGLSWLIQTSLWKNTSGSKKKKLKDKVEHLIGKLPEPTIGYFDDLDFFKDFENEFPTIVYNDLKSKSDQLNEPSAKTQKLKSSPRKTVAFAAKGSINFDTDKIMVRMDSMTMKMDARYKELQSPANDSDSNNDDIPIIDIIDKIIKEDFVDVLDKEREILHSNNETIIEEKRFAEFDEFMAINIEEDTESETKEIPFEKITFNTDYKIKTSLEEPPLDLELKPLPDHLEYVFLEEPTFLPVIISSHLSEQNKRSPPQARHHHGAAVVVKVGSAATTLVVLGADHPDASLGVAPSQPDTTSGWKSRRCCCCGGCGGVSGVEWGVVMMGLWRQRVELVVVPGTVATAMVVSATGGGAWRWWMVDLIDRDTGSIFGVRRKISPAKGLRHHSPTQQGAAVVAVPSPDRHHNGGKKSKDFGRFYNFFAGCGGRSATHSPTTTAAADGKAIAVAVVGVAVVLAVLSGGS
uniref:Reverse transcriptase domain-containing protein n=1 Tax=Tanacetum cinerariifolium TaxID=118510 RepID=A0A6L2NS43_TANCI|nr:reverse transcriptase domain-containing protein [Tanacetum cinerariifolium]